MKIMTQNIQNGEQCLLPFHPTRRGGAHGAQLAPPRFGPKLFAKNVINVF